MSFSGSDVLSSHDLLSHRESVVLNRVSAQYSAPSVVTHDSFVHPIVVPRSSNSNDLERENVMCSFQYTGDQVHPFVVKHLGDGEVPSLMELAARTAAAALVGRCESTASSYASSNQCCKYEMFVPSLSALLVYCVELVSRFRRYVYAHSFFVFCWCSGLRCPYANGVCCASGQSCCPTGSVCLPVTFGGTQHCATNQAAITPAAAAEPPSHPHAPATPLTDSESVSSFQLYARV